ncbi:hypothetical protein HZS_741 [Henneguya salminicola]|nr:hypothetical protein HZS_741 [Henneguya salminicola]
MSEIISNVSEVQTVPKTSPCARYQRHDKSLENLIGIGSTYMGMDLEEGIEVLWVELNSKNSDLVRIRHHFDTIIRFDHPNLLRCRTYWIEENIEEVVLYVICELISNTLVHFIKRTKLNNKSIPLKTQIRISKQILFGLNYLNCQNPPYFIPKLSSKIVFMTHDGTIKLSTLIPNQNIHALLIGKEVAEFNDGDQLYESIVNFGKIIYAMVVLDLTVDGLGQLIKNSQEIEGLTKEQIDLLIMIVKNKNIKISDLFRSRLLFQFPTLKLLSGAAILRNRIDLSSFNLEFDPNDVFATFKDVNREISYSDVPSLTIDDYLLEIKQGLHPLAIIAYYDGYRRSADISRCISPTSFRRQGSNEIYDSPTNIKSEDDNFPALDDLGGILAVQCRQITLSLPLSPPSANNPTKLKISFLYENYYCRLVETDVSLENITAESLVEDLINEKLISDKYKSYIIELIGRTLKGEEVSLILTSK